jgi:hypothetical protein
MELTVSHKKRTVWKHQIDVLRRKNCHTLSYDTAIYPIFEVSRVKNMS